MIALAIAVIVLFFVPLLMPKFPRRLKFSGRAKGLLWALVATVGLLTWIGARPVEDPYILVGQALTALYFLLYLAAGCAKAFCLRASSPIFSA